MTPTVMLWSSAGLIFLACALALSIVGVATSERRGVARSLAAIRALDAAGPELAAELDRPFTERVVAPFGARLVGVGRHLVRADAAERIQHRLDVAGNPSGWDVSRFIGVKVLALLVLGGLGFLWTVGSGSGPRVLLATGIFGGFGFVLPDVLLYNAGVKRSKQMQRALPDALDLLTICVESGLGFDAAMHQVARNTKGPLAQELSRLLQEIQIGLGRTDAMRAMAERTTLADLRSFCLAMVQADQLGIPLARVLRVQSREMRVKRRQSAEESAQKVPVKIMMPLVLFILPCLFLVVGGPAAIQVLHAFER